MLFKIQITFVFHQYLDDVGVLLMYDRVAFQMEIHKQSYDSWCFGFSADVWCYP